MERLAHEDSLAGRRAVVTGGARGLGRRFAEHLASRGARVAVLDLDLEAATAFAYEAEQTPVTAIAELALTADVTDPAVLREAARQVEREWGGLDILVCNAGGGVGGIGTTAASTLDLEAARLTIDRNLVGTINTVVTFAPLLSEEGAGRVITVSSHAGLLPASDGSYAHYAAAKSGVAMYTAALAQDLGRRGISVNCIAPGNIATGRLREALPPQVERLAREATALRRIGTEDDCAELVGFLASDAAQFITGTTIPVDGGTLRRQAIDAPSTVE